MRKVLVAMSGILLILAGFLIAGFSIGTYMVLNNNMDQILAQESGGALTNFNPVMIIFIYLPFAVWIFATGLGMILKKNWSRYSLFVISGFMIFIGLIMALLFLFMPVPNTENAMGLAGRLISAVVSAILLLGIPVFFLIFFNKQPVKELFLKDKINSVLAPSPRPLGVKIIAVLSFLGGLNMIYVFTPLMFKAMPLIGTAVVLQGFAMRLYFLAVSALSLWIGFGVWKLKPYGWIACMITYILGIIMGMINLIATTPDKLFAVIYGSDFTAPPMSLIMYKFMVGLGLLVPAAVIIYLKSRRKLFFAAN